ncbi:MAG TPA: hypothetical protein ENG70_00945 [Candidatus Cloacimonetes bacterium]|nr:hypothetical protein [Candidatus Cloacimonadota bacterium]HEX37421.1 hypothetical protein [Candidatus Cloacimonadota bacterium]
MKGIEQKRNRVLRGGSWNNNDNNCRVANRNNNNPDNSNNNNGFRFVNTTNMPDSTFLNNLQRVHIWESSLIS